MLSKLGFFVYCKFIDLLPGSLSCDLIKKVLKFFFLKKNINGSSLLKMKHEKKLGCMKYSLADFG